MDSKTPQSDFVQRFILEELDIRGAVVRLTGSWKRMLEGRSYPMTVQRLLGEMTATTLLVGSSLKSPSRITFQVQGNGPVPVMVVDCTEKLRFRGVAKFRDDVQPASTPELFGDGELILSLENRDSVRPYQSLVPLVGESVAEIFENYIAQSDQQDTRLLFSVSPDTVAGLLLQKLPDADAMDPEGWARINRLASTLTSHEMLSVPLRSLLPRLFPENSVRLFDANTVAYECPRDREKITTMLRSLGKRECEAILREHGEILVADDICNYTYRFDHEDVEDLFGELELSPRVLH